MLANCQNDKRVPNRVASPSEPIDPGQNAVVGGAPDTSKEESFGEVSSVKDQTDKIGYEGWENGG